MRVLLIAALVMAGCSSTTARFPLAEPLRIDPDTNPVSIRPAEYESPKFWDIADMSLFYPLTRWLAVESVGPSVNVNALGEVPNSSWFTNRMGAHPSALDVFRRGACPALPIEREGPWTVVGAKPNGVNPGLMIKAADGRRYLVKFDGLNTPERAGTADVVGAIIYYAAGYFTSCNTIVQFDPRILKISPKAKVKDKYGEKHPMTRADVDKALAGAVRLPDGRLRGSASLFLSGRPLGPWRYQGTRSDDPNDVIPHQQRRDLRGARLLAAWLDHFDAREQNTLAMWVEDERGHHVRHNYLDFGDSFGAMDMAVKQMLPRVGHTYYLDLQDLLVDLFTLGIPTRPWEDKTVDPEAPLFGFFDAAHFDPEAWKVVYPNPAFSQMQEADGAWMARIIARFTDVYIEAAVAEAHLSDPAHAKHLVTVLAARRDRLLARYLTRLSPLADFKVSGETLCFTDLAQAHGALPSAAFEVAYRGEGTRWDKTLPSGGPRRCVDLGLGARPEPSSPPDRPARYRTVTIRRADVPGPAVLHLYDLGQEGHRLVGVERPEE